MPIVCALVPSYKVEIARHFEPQMRARPLIVADLPPLVELAQPGERGLAFIPGDPAALADAVTTLLDHPEQATRLADRGRQWVLTERTGAAHGQLYQDVYQELMDRWRPAGQPAGRAGKPT